MSIIMLVFSGMGMGAAVPAGSAFEISMRKAVNAAASKRNPVKIIPPQFMAVEKLLASRLAFPENQILLKLLGLVLYRSACLIQKYINN